MHRCVVVSDTHGNRRLLGEALALARARVRVDTVVHLGDEHTDIQGFVNEGEETVVVPGLHHPDYGDGTTPISRVHRLGDLTIGMAHQPSARPALGHERGPSGPAVGPGAPGNLRGLEIADGLVRVLGLAATGESLIESCWPLHLLEREGF
ncbi:metallophosphoesterase family protein [Candidatus Fermentibacteria bacterium]|nr:metallophosphoesterase family protein [Candidatus Fermentibacteria bacterium]